ncbi:MAG: ATP-binding cassette domain-containing protein [SAR202 cluster bacterium]|nr:ATP-binding cassette domain-containing protein [SAR202 cluster bacterium]
MSEPAYVLQGISKQFHGREVCRVPELVVPSGSLTVIMGHNGAGKSTLLRMLGFLERPDEGALSFCGSPVDYRRSVDIHHRRAVTMVFQSPIFFSGTALSNVEYGLKLRGQNAASAEAMRALEAAGLAGMASARAATMSAGEQQRVALARALAILPAVLLLDEPTANLDPQNTAMVERIVARLNREDGTTVVLVTQNVFQARRLATHAGVMLYGALAESGPAQEVLNAPRDGRVRAFLAGEAEF